MNTARFFVLVAIAIVIVGIGYLGYTFVKDQPPRWLVNLVSKPQNDAPPVATPGEQVLTVPEGFKATVFAKDIDGARVMIRDPKGALLVSETEKGKVVALPDTDADGKADRTVTVLENLSLPHGLLIDCPSTGNESADQDACILYVAQTGVLNSYRYDADTFTATYIKTITTLPTGSGHFTRTLLMHPDGKRILISVGSSCNVCDESDNRRASILQVDIATGKVSTFAKGLRNTVFMATDPVKGGVWGTDNGRDLLGDNLPPDEVNILTEGSDYGWPICYGDNIHDTDFDKRQYIRDPCADKVAPWIKLQAHSAALGIAFIPEEGWPDGMGNDLLLAFHGSWNRSEPTGYKVVRIHLGADRRAIGAPIDFLTGFIPPEGKSADDSIGRPVGLLAEPGGVLFVSDDRAGAIYKITRTNLD